MLCAGHEEEAMIGADYATQAEMNICENHMPGIFAMRLLQAAAIRPQAAFRRYCTLCGVS
jgi:hypothetical protein